MASDCKYDDGKFLSEKQQKINSWILKSPVDNSQGFTFHTFNLTGRYA
jgi:hypothetical protein